MDDIESLKVISFDFTKTNDSINIENISIYKKWRRFPISISFSNNDPKKLPIIDSTLKSKKPITKYD